MMCKLLAFCVKCEGVTGMHPADDPDQQRIALAYLQVHRDRGDLVALLSYPAHHPLPFRLCRCAEHPVPARCGARYGESARLH